MVNCRRCDNCKRILSEEWVRCKPEEIVFHYKLYHFGEGMHTPWKEIRVEFCCRDCFSKWFGEKFPKWLKEKQID